MLLDDPVPAQQSTVAQCDPFTCGCHHADVLTANRRGAHGVTLAVAGLREDDLVCVPIGQCVAASDSPHRTALLDNVSVVSPEFILN